MTAFAYKELYFVGITLFIAASFVIDMGSSVRLFGRQRTVHQILGGGLVAEVVLWRQRNITSGILLMALTVWVVFERSGYTLLSLSSSVLLLLMTILFVWSKAASLLNRPAPPLPDIYLTEETVAEVGEFARTQLNALFSIGRNVALGKDSRLFLRVAVCLLLIFAVGSSTDLVSLCYTCLVLVLILPVLYEKFEDQIDRHVMCVYRTLRQTCIKLDEHITILKEIDLDKIE